MSARILVLPGGRPVRASDPYPGSVHDVAALDSSGLLEGIDPSSSPEGARGGHVVHGPRIGAPGPTRTLHRAGPGIRVVHARASVLDRPQIAAVAPVPAGEIECRRPPRWSQSRGISSAVSRRTAGVRQIAARTMLLWRMYITAARSDPDTPRITFLVHEIRWSNGI